MSLAAVQARIAEIQARVTPSAPAGSGTAFNAYLAAAATDQAASSAAVSAVGVDAMPVAADQLVRPPALHQPHAHGKVTPPPELAAYGNGKIPATALTPVGDGNHRLWGPAAEAFKRLRAAAAADGVTFGVTDSYRSYEQQVDLARRKGLYSEGGLAATPGTSNHGWGLSLDLDLDGRAQAWMRANGERFGFVEDVPREPWHWTYHGGA